MPADEAQQLQAIAGFWHKQGNAVDLLATMRNAPPAGADGTVTLDNGRGIVSLARYRPPVTFQIVLMSNIQDTRIAYAANQIIFNWELVHTELRVDGGPASGKHKPGVGQLPADQWTAIEMTVTPAAMIIDVDGQEIYNVAGDFSRVNEPLSITAHNGTLKVHSVKVIASPK